MKLNWSHENFRVLGIDKDSKHSRASLNEFSLPSRIRKVSSAYKLMRDSTSLIIIP
jgi:uncharacterized protein (DUF2132 family)